MPTFRELLRVAEVTMQDKTSARRMNEIRKILSENGAFSGLTPEKATQILIDLGPTFVKIGQIASNRSDMLPQEYCTAFAKLRTSVDPMDFPTVIREIEESYGHPWQETFSAIEQTPLGSASIAQVHKGALHDGTVVAIKVRRPGIVQQMAEDITLIRHLLALAELSSAASGSIVLTLDDLISEVEQTTADEIDFNVELKNLERFYEDTREQRGITSPRPFAEHTTSEVLVMEFATGTFINSIGELRSQGYDLDAIGQTLTQSYVTQILDKGFFHADPHPGNLLIAGNNIVWIDLGMTGTLTAGERSSVGRVFRAIARQDAFDLKETLLGLAKAKNSVDHGKLLDQMSAMLASYTSLGIADLNIGTALMDVIDVLHTQNLRLPSSFTMLARGLVTLEGVLVEVAPSISAVEVVSKRVQEQTFQFSNIETKLKEFMLTFSGSVEATARIPSQLSNTLDMLDRGQIKVTMDMKLPENMMTTLYLVGGRVSLAMISAGLFIGSSVLCTTAMEPRWLGVPVLGFLGYLGAFALGTYVIWRTLNTRREMKKERKREAEQ